MNVGTIDLGLDVNQSSFNRQLNGIAGGAQRSVVGAFSGLGKAIGITLGAAAVVAFGKSCIDMGSDLAEVQNVVDVTFGAMADDINKFASTAIVQFGMSETAAKKYASTMGAMLKSMGLGTQQAVKMSQVMAGLSADMASFYNLDSKEAFDKIRAGISGETEPLKQLGINMSVANLEAYALSQGITKAYSKMSQQEQVLLRYNYLLSTTADAQGDFARTSDSWANQTRVLSEQFNALKATLGQAFINMLTPVVKMLNTMILRLQQAANYFKAFTEAAFGKQEVAQGAADIATAGADASESMLGIGDSTAEAVKTAKKALAGFDEVNTLSKEADGADLSGALGGLGAENVDLGGLPDATSQASEDAAKLKEFMDDISSKLQPVKELVIDIGKSFWNGFIKPIQEVNFDSIKSGLSSIGGSLKYIVSDKNVQTSAEKFVTDYANMVGKLNGNIVKIGLNFADGLINGVADGLNKKKDIIVQRLTSIFGNLSKISIGLGNIFDIAGDISTVFTSENAKRIWSSITQTLIETSTGAWDIGTRFVADLVAGVETILANNKEGIKTAFDNAFGVIATVFETIQGAVEDTMDAIYMAYWQYIQPAISNFTELFSELGRIILNAYNEHIAPTLQECAEIFDEVFKEHVQPAIDTAIDVLGTLIKCISDILVHFTPVYEFLAKILVPFFMGAFKIGFQTVIDVIAILFDWIKDLLQIFKGVLEFITGVFTGDWNRAWEGIKTAFGGVWNFIEDTVNGVITAIENRIKNTMKLAEDMVLAVKEAFGLSKGKDMTSLEVFKQDMQNVDMTKWSDKQRSQFLESQKSSGMWSQDIQDYVMNLPHYANGGIIDTPQLAVLGEGGKKEAVIPLENSSFTKAFALEVANAIGASSGYNSKSSGPITLVIDIDGREAAKILVPYLPEASRRMGVDLSGS